MKSKQPSAFQAIAYVGRVSNKSSASKRAVKRLVETTKQRSQKVCRQNAETLWHSPKGKVRIGWNPLLPQP